MYSGKSTTTSNDDPLRQLMQASTESISIDQQLANSSDNGIITKSRRDSMKHLRNMAGSLTSHMPQDSSPPPSPIIIAQEDPTPVPGTGTLPRNTADILNFVAKQQSKSIATKELLRHLVFVVIFLTIVSLQRSVFESYLMNQSLTAAFVTQQIDSGLQPFPKTFLDVGQPEELRDFLLSVLGGTLDEKEHYNGLPLTPYQRNFFMTNNRLLGGVRFRQLRAAPNKGCKVPADLVEITKLCYSYGYNSYNRDTTPYGPVHDPQRWAYQSGEETGSPSIYSTLLFNVEGGGYVVDLPLGSNFTEQIRKLVDFGWWDSATRAIVVTMNFLSIDLGDLVTVMYMVIELPGSGEAIPSVIFKSFRLNLYETTEDWFRMCLEILFLVILINMIVREIQEMKSCYRSKRGLRKYFDSGWNLNELVTISLFLAAIGVYLRYVASTHSHPSMASTTYFPQMEQIASHAAVYFNILYFNILLVSFQTFKYLRMNKRLYMLWKTLQHAGTNLFGFLFIFLIFVFGFVFVSWLAFGAEMHEFSSFNSSFGTCWNFLIGNPPDYDRMVATNPVMGPIFFTLFTIFIFFILANVFIAIVGNSFSEVSKSVAGQIGIKEAINSKISNCYKSTKRIVKKLTKKSHKNKRSILQILETLAFPEALEKPGLSIEDVFRACGPETTEAEAWELFEWIEKLESKKKQQTFKARKNSVMIDLTRSEEDLPGTELKPAQKSDYIELLHAVDSLREDVARLFLLLPQLQSSSPSPAPAPSPSPSPAPSPSPIIRSSTPSASPRLSPAPQPAHPHPSPPQLSLNAAAQQDPPPSPRRRPSFDHHLQLDRPERPHLTNSRDNMGPPPPTPPAHAVPHVPFTSMLQVAQAQSQSQSHSHSHEHASPSHSTGSPSIPLRTSTPPSYPPPTPNIRTSAQHIPTLPPPPHDHHHHAHSHDHTHGILTLPLGSSASKPNSAPSSPRSI